MDRREFLQGMGGVLLSSMVPVDMISKMMVKQCSSYTDFTPDSSQFDLSLDPLAQTVIGIGPLGADVARSLARDGTYSKWLPSVFDPGGSNVADLGSVLTTVRQSDLLFICSGFEDQHCGTLWEVVTDTACEAAVPTVGVMPGDDAASIPGRWVVPEVTKSITSLFQVSAPSLQGCLPDFSSPNTTEVLTGIAMCHLVASITNLYTQPGMIGICFSDILTVLKSGQSAHVGVGLAGGSSRGRNATEMALEQLHRQRVPLGLAKGVMVNITADLSMTLDDYEDVSQVIHRQCHPDANIIIGLLIDEVMGGAVRVTVMTFE